jgi:DNA polymerase
LEELLEEEQGLTKKFIGKTATAIMEFPNNKILLIKRGTVVFRGYWGLPGGKVDAGETVEEAVLREVREETGLTVEIVSKIGEYHESGIQDGIEYDYYPTCFFVKRVEGKMRRQKGEIEQIKLFDLNEIPERLAFKHSAMIQDYLRTKGIIELDEEIRKCKKCRLHKTRTNAVPGEGPANAKIMICGQAPGRTEDEDGKPFMGRAGRFLNELLETIKLKRELLFITSPIKCFPPNNRPPKSDELKTCRPYLKKQISIVRPKIIIALGNYALQTLLGNKLTISQLHGRLQESNSIIIFPTFHPAAAIRFPKIKALTKEDFKQLKSLLTKLDLP